MFNTSWNMKYIVQFNRVNLKYILHHYAHETILILHITMHTRQY